MYTRVSQQSQHGSVHENPIVITFYVMCSDTARQSKLARPYGILITTLT